MRIGFPVRNIQKDNDFVVKSNNINMKSNFNLISSEKLTRKALHDRQIEQQYSAIFKLPVELPLYILLTLITFYLGTKIIVYFISFYNYNIVNTPKREIAWRLILKSFKVLHNLHKVDSKRSNVSINIFSQMFNCAQLLMQYFFS